MSNRASIRNETEKKPQYGQIVSLIKLSRMIVLQWSD
jgi:hypothetical protein